VLETLEHRPEAGRTYTAPPGGATRRGAPEGPRGQPGLGRSPPVRRQLLGSVMDSLSFLWALRQGSRPDFFFAILMTVGRHGPDSAHRLPLALQPLEIDRKILFAWRPGKVLCRGDSGPCESSGNRGDRV